MYATHKHCKLTWAAPPKRHPWPCECRISPGTPPRPTQRRVSHPDLPSSWDSPLPPRTQGVESGSGMLLRKIRHRLLQRITNCVGADQGNSGGVKCEGWSQLRPNYHKTMALASSRWGLGEPHGVARAKLGYKPRHSAAPRLASPHLTSPCLALPRLASPRLASPRLASPRLASPRLVSRSPRQH